MSTSWLFSIILKVVACEFGVRPSRPGDIALGTGEMLAAAFSPALVSFAFQNVQYDAGLGDDDGIAELMIPLSISGLKAIDLRVVKEKGCEG